MRKTWNPVCGLTVALALALTLTASTFASAQTLGDADGDGVTDTVDACPNTPRGDLVDKATGCSFCACDAAWASHQAYVDCVTAAANQQFLAKLIIRSRKTQAISAARNSTCGTTNVTRCCQWRKLIAGSMGTCTIMDPARCSYQALGKWAEIRGSGSCTFNPCTW